MTQPDDSPGTDAARAVIYAAKSTEDKRGSIPTQIADCRAFAEREGLEVVAEYQDEAASAWSGNRGPGLASALDHAERIGGALVVQHSDRLARGDGRQARHLAQIYFWALGADVRLRSVQDDSTFTNPLLAVALGERNAEDSTRKSHAVKAGLQRTFERGEFPGGPCPDGFQAVATSEGDEVRRDVRLDPERAEIIRLIGDLSDQGWGDSSVARELNRRGLRTRPRTYKSGQRKGETSRPGAWTRRRIQDTLTNPLYYGGIPRHRGTPDFQINWDTSYPSPWTREDWERRQRARSERDLAAGSDRTHPRGVTWRNHALAGLALCAECGERMRPRTSPYRRKDGSRRRTYICRHVQDGTGLCHAPEIDAELVDTHVIDGLHRYLGDFETWREQLLAGYTSDQERLEREVARAREDLGERERIRERYDRALGLAEDDAQAKAAMRGAAKADEDLARARTRLEAAEQALADVPTEAPADAMLDWYNELGEAVRGRLSNADTLPRVNDALRDLFSGFVLASPPHALGGEGIMVVPVLQPGSASPWTPLLERAGDERLAGTPPLRVLHANQGSESGQL